MSRGINACAAMTAEVYTAIKATVLSDGGQYLCGEIKNTYFYKQTNKLWLEQGIVNKIVLANALSADKEISQILRFDESLSRACSLGYTL